MAICRRLRRQTFLMFLTDHTSGSLYNPMILLSTANILVSNHLQDDHSPPQGREKIVLKNWLLDLQDRMEEISSHWGFTLETNDEWAAYYIREYNCGGFASITRGDWAFQRA